MKGERKGKTGKEQENEKKDERIPAQPPNAGSGTGLPSISTTIECTP